jgi:hypothetical protein
MLHLWPTNLPYTLYGRSGHLTSTKGDYYVIRKDAAVLWFSYTQ